MFHLRQFQKINSYLSVAKQSGFSDHKLFHVSNIWRFMAEKRQRFIRLYFLELDVSSTKKRYTVFLSLRGIAKRVQMFLKNRCLLAILLFAALGACQPNSPDDFYNEGTSIVKSLILDLREVNSKEELQELSPRIKKKMHKLSSLMIMTAKYHKKHPSEAQREFLHSDRLYSDMLLDEFKRLYTIEGCQEIMEVLQRDALHKLDAYLQYQR